MVPLSDFLMILGDIIIYEFVVGVSESFLFRIVETYITFQGVRKKPTTTITHTYDKIVSTFQWRIKNTFFKKLLHQGIFYLLGDTYESFLDLYDFF